MAPENRKEKAFESGLCGLVVIPAGLGTIPGNETLEIWREFPREFPAGSITMLNAVNCRVMSPLHLKIGKDW